MGQHGGKGIGIESRFVCVWKRVRWEDLNEGVTQELREEFTETICGTHRALTFVYKGVVLGVCIYSVCWCKFADRDKL